MANFGQTLMSSLDKSLFTKSSYSQAVRKDDGLYRIEIIPILNSSRTEIPIIGVIQEPISISMDPEWDVLNLASIVSNFPKIESLFNMAVAPMAAAGVSLTNAGLSTEKFFVKGSYIKIDVNFKVVNWDDDGQPLRASTLLLNLCTPQKSRYSIEYGEVVDNLLEVLNNMNADEIEVLKNLGVLGDIVANLSKFLGGVITTSEKVVGALKGKLPADLRGSVDEGLKRISVGEFMLTNSPPAVQVKIGNYFDHPEMIIENISCDLSKQMTKTGPMFANFKVSFSSKSMPLIAGKDKYSTGLTLKKKRVEIQGKELNTTGVR